VSAAGRRVTGAGEGRAAPGRALVVGVGARPGTSANRLGAAVRRALAEIGADRGEVRVLATIDRRAGEAGVRELAAAEGWRLTSFAAAELAGHDVPHRSARVAAAVGTGSVAEAAALAAGGPGAELLLSKRVFAGVVVAVAGTLAP
jgi:cobalt-precorrin 5A hydrolase